MAKEKKGVRLEHISKIYQDPKTKKDFYAVHDANLEIAPGEFVTLLGPSGCGKTTILRMIAGFESPDEGQIYLGGEPINDLTPNKRDTAMVFQSYALLPHYNIFDNVAYGLKIRKLPAEEIREKVTRILGMVGLEGMEDRMTNQLSGGQQQRVALARALVIEPSVLLFDEPLSNLDAKLRVEMRTEVRRIQQEAGITAVYVTHDQSEAMARLATRTPSTIVPSTSLWPTSSASPTSCVASLPRRRVTRASRPSRGTALRLTAFPPTAWAMTSPWCCVPRRPPSLTRASSTARSHSRASWAATRTTRSW